MWKFPIKPWFLRVCLILSKSLEKKILCGWEPLRSSLAPHLVGNVDTALDRSVGQIRSSKALTAFAILYPESNMGPDIIPCRVPNRKLPIIHGATSLVLPQ